jgi:hypothetical protein
MNKILSQFKRIYSDDGRGDHDFSGQEEALREANERIVSATTRLVKASEQLNVAALRAFPTKSADH